VDQRFERKIGFGDLKHGALLPLLHSNDVQRATFKVQR